MFASGVSIAYAESMDTIAQNMKEVRPTIVVAVPRIYEKIYAPDHGHGDAARAASSVRSSCGRARSGNGGRTSCCAGMSLGFVLALEHRIADKLVFAKVRAAVGGRLRYFVSGSAPLSDGDQPILLCGGAQDSRRLWAHGDVARHRGEHSKAYHHRNRRCADSRRGGEDRRRRRDPHARTARDEGLLQSARGDEGGDRSPRAGSTPETSGRSRTGCFASPIARRTSSSPRAGRTSRRSRSRIW